MVINDVVYDVNDTLYRLLVHLDIYYSYVRYGIYFRVYVYGSRFIHACCYYYNK